MMQRQDPGTPLSGIVGVSDRPRASTNIERDSLGGMASGYIPNASSVEAVKIFSAGLGRGAALSIIGPYGSGKSTFGMVLGHLAAPRLDPGWKTAYGMLRGAAPDAAASLVAGRRRAGLHERGMIRCVATARLEPVAATVLRAAANGAASYFGESYGRRSFAEAGTLRRCVRSLRKGTVPDAATVAGIVADMAASTPVLLVIDEFGKNIEYFADGGSDGDLFLLQDLAEMTGPSRGVRLHMVTMQHMALGEYVAGTSAARVREWAKIQGRFESIHFANSLEHTRALLSSSLSHDGGMSHRIMEWAGHHARAAAEDAGVDIPAEIAASCYPLHPLAVEALPELCFRYGQNNRTLLSFVFGSGPGTVARFVENEMWDGRGALPTMGADDMYDYFISGSAPARAGAAASSRLVEIDTIVRDASVSNETERRTLKAIGLMNLIGSSGRLRASMGMIRCMVGRGAERAVGSLESRSIITYRRHADEYRIWHGTDVNIATKVDAWRNAVRHMSYPDIMRAAMDPEPVIAARHGIKTGTLRVFASLFEMPEGGLGPEYDGAVVYGTMDMTIPASERPVLVSRCRDTSGLAGAAVEVAALRATLKDGDITGDWVAKTEVGERLAAAENALRTEFDRAYGAGAAWAYMAGGNVITFRGTASSAASAASDAAYPDAPPIYNEMINRNRLTPQGSTALNRLLHLMIANEGKERLGLEGWKPERAIYEAVIREHRVHKEAGGRYMFLRPNIGRLRGAWGAALSRMRGTRKAVALTDIYRIWKMPPYGIKDGVMPILALLIMLATRGNVAVYEHGSFVPRLSAGRAERMVKNPGHFSLKYYHKTKSRAALVENVAERLGADPKDGMVGVVGRLVWTVRMLPVYTGRSKNLSKTALAVRNAIQGAVEPDTLLFESLPRALGMGPLGRSIDMRVTSRFASSLTRSVNELLAAFDNMMDEMRQLLLKETGTPDRPSLAKMASDLLPDVSDQRMKVFLGAVSADIPDEKAWISYVGLALTDAPPAEWSDEHRSMFSNGLREVGAGFRRLAALRFAAVSDSFGRPSVLVTITHPDGREERMVLPADDERVAGLADGSTRKSVGWPGLKGSGA